MKDSITSISVSFTGTILVFSICELLNIVPPITSGFVLILFLMTVTIGVCNELLNLYEKKIRELPILLDFSIRLLCCYISVFFLGSLLGMMPFQWISIWYITPVILPVFTTTYFIMLSTAKRSADSINKKLERQKNCK